MWQMQDQPPSPCEASERNADLGEGDWLELSCPAEAEAVESLAAEFARVGQGVAVEQPVISSRDGDEVVIPADAPLTVKTYLSLLEEGAQEKRDRLERAVWALGQLRRVGPLTVRRIREDDWANAWKTHFFVHRVGKQIVIVPTWRRDEFSPQPGDAMLLLDPGMAFGTGLHPTTRLCLRALEDYLRPADRVLDLGAGSGILAIAAARLGAGHVDAVEIDPVAVEVCRANVRQNEVAERVAVQAGGVETLSGRSAEYDLVVANITIRVLLDAFPAVGALLVPGGVAIFSGVLEERADELLGSIIAAGWRHVESQHEQDWVALVTRSPGDPDAS